MLSERGPVRLSRQCRCVLSQPADVFAAAAQTARSGAATAASVAHTSGLPHAERITFCCHDCAAAAAPAAHWHLLTALILSGLHRAPVCLIRLGCMVLFDGEHTAEWSERCLDAAPAVLCCSLTFRRTPLAPQSSSSTSCCVQQCVLHAPSSAGLGRGLSGPAGRVRRRGAAAAAAGAAAGAGHPGAAALCGVPVGAAAAGGAGAPGRQAYLAGPRAGAPCPAASVSSCCLSIQGL